MYRDVLRAASYPAAANFIRTGAENSCVFCQARQLTRFAVGTSVTLLNGWHAGRKAKVVDGGPLVRIDQVAVRGDCQQREGFRICSLGRNLLIADDIPPHPNWLAPLSMDDLFQIDEAILRILPELLSERSLRQKALIPIIEAVWWLRLPVNAKDVFPACVAHGLRRDYEEPFSQLFDFGLTLLRQTQGRAPVMRRRMVAMSAARYQPQRRNPSLQQLYSTLSEW